ncbi:hypothetical protein ACH3XW_46470 [Acanthocheilonema viteae]
MAVTPEGKEMGCRLLWMEGSVNARSDGILEEDSIYRVDHCIHTYILKKFSGVVAAVTTSTAATAAAAAAVAAVFCKVASKK